MILPLIYYLGAILTYILLYGYYKNNKIKLVARSDYLESLETAPAPSAPLVNKKPFEQIKKMIVANCQFERVRVVFGIDFSASNEFQGRKTFQGQPLHKTQDNKIYNPYQKAIAQTGAIFEKVFGPEHFEYSCFGFGDEHSKDYTFFPIVGTGEGFNQYQRVLDAYLEQTKTVVYGGPTAFTPIIRKLISFGIHSPKDFTMLVLITDELKISNQDKALVESIRVLSSLPNVCLIVIGVGDGPWQRMSYEEHALRELVFSKVKPPKTKKLHEQIGQTKYVYDNFHFVDFNPYIQAVKTDKPLETGNSFARAVLKKLPLQLKQGVRHSRIARAEAEAAEEAAAVAEVDA